MFYKLNEQKNLVVCNDPKKWAEWFIKTDRIVAEDKIGNIKISTGFTGIDLICDESEEPILFQTMIFAPNKNAELIDQYYTWQEALSGHKRAVARYALKAV